MPYSQGLPNKSISLENENETSLQVKNSTRLNREHQRKPRKIIKYETRSLIFQEFNHVKAKLTC